MDKQPKYITDVINRRGIVLFNSSLIRDGNQQYVVPSDSKWVYLAPGEYAMKPFPREARSIMVLRETAMTWYRRPQFDDYIGSFDGGAHMYLGVLEGDEPESIKIYSSVGK